MIPTADQVATAIVTAARQADVDPLSVYAPGERHGRARLVAALGLVQASIASVGGACAVCGFSYNNALSPSRVKELRIPESDIDAVVAALRSAGHGPVRILPKTGYGNWSPGEDALVLQGVDGKLNDLVISRTLLPGRTPASIKKRRGYLKQLGTIAKASSPPVCVKPAPVVAEPRPIPTPVAPTFVAPAAGRFNAYTRPPAFPNAPVASSECLDDRIAVALTSRGSLTASTLAHLTDAKELTVAQALSAMARNGLVEAGPVPPEGRRAQRWSAAGARASA